MSLLNRDIVIVIGEINNSIAKYIVAPRYIWRRTAKKLNKNNKNKTIKKHIICPKRGKITYIAKKFTAAGMDSFGK